MRRGARRLLVHELRALRSLGLWVARRRHGVGPGAHPAAYTGPQTAMVWGLIAVSVVEGVVFAVLVPWPFVHRLLVVVHVYGVVMMVGLHAACVVRPHVAEADGGLRIRYGALFDLRLSAEEVREIRVDRRYPEGKLIQPREDGSLELIVGGQTTVTVELAAPVPYIRPLGRRGTATTVRFHADDPAALVAAVGPARARKG
ncbi:hypothetical protein [Streptomyces clavuligerus]|uniref:Uncharacterized protein n=1 Tax=Streptomyces clavuligerus TaxID=1901 RepID=B5GZ88_STRCL|nr:hypothetical protein [Streptomyces clavuligerus]ANW20430.1 hypothetical protein BB341_20560 [Streptomyces clavuligerus]AXU15054.1 hypothetical protein D1794_21400 [Streptomyces clavuligerus]EDY51634.1 integral membrane protein [Streptomyces clavuligerus]EFG06603.1 Hypothetical protein SCLAV_1528 [Streptomyces clavuligerus]MBY6305110.1 hypothetical protein [Streptomyces clavuligerus]